MDDEHAPICKYRTSIGGDEPRWTEAIGSVKQTFLRITRHSRADGVWRTVVQSDEKEATLQEAHCGIAEDATARKIWRNSFWWRTTLKGSVWYSKECDLCQRMSTNATPAGLNTGPISEMGIRLCQTVQANNTTYWKLVYHSGNWLLYEVGWGQLCGISEEVSCVYGAGSGVQSNLSVPKADTSSDRWSKAWWYFTS